MLMILCVLFFIVIVEFTLFFLFWRNENLLTAKTRLTYASCIITVILALIYSLFFGQNGGLPEYVRTLGILSVISIVVLIAGVFIKEIGVEQVIPEDIDKKSNAKVFLTIFGVAIASRLIIYFIGYLYSIQAMDLKAGFFEGFNSMWNRWDSLHYLNLAQNGYAASGENAKLIVFYPLYSLLVGIVERIFGNYLLAGVIVSDLSLGIGCFYLYKLARIDFDEETAIRSVKYMLIYPFSFFFGIAYTESLCVALSLMSLYYMRKNKWLAAGICGFLAALTKNQGIILIVPVFIEYVLSSQVFKELKNKNYKNIIKSFLTKGIYMFIIPLGTFVYLLINKILFGSWNEFVVISKKRFQ